MFRKNKVTKFFLIGALMIFIVYFGAEQTDPKVMIAGAVFAAAAVISAVGGVILQKFR